MEYQIKKLKKYLVEVKDIRDQGALANKEKTQESWRLFRAMFSTLKESYSDFNATWDKLAEMDASSDEPGNFPTEDHDKMEAAIKRYRLEALYSFEKLKEHDEAAESAEREINRSLNNTALSSSRLRLPKVQLPQFSGSMADWINYRDTFKAFVHEDLQMPEVEKYQLLISSLQGTALQLVKAAPSLHADYQKSWQALLNKYDNVRLIAGHYLDSICDFKAMSSNSLPELERYLYHMRGAIDHFKSLVIPEQTDFILMHVALGHLHKDIRWKFEDQYRDTTFPKTDHLLKFIEEKVKAGTVANNLKHIHLTKNIPLRKPSGNIRSQNPFQKKANSSSALHMTKKNFEGTRYNEEKLTCVVCQGPHTIPNCPKYIQATPSYRYNTLLKSFEGCLNCLHPNNHRTKDCPSVNRCKQCGSHHHTTLHFPRKGDQNAHRFVGRSTSDQSLRDQGHAKGEVTSSETSNALSAVEMSQQEILLGTALGRIKTHNGGWKTVRMLLDTGSQHSFVTKELADVLGLKPSKRNHHIKGIGGGKILNSNYTVLCNLKSGRKQGDWVTEAVVVDKITGLLPQTVVPSKVREAVKQYPLADPSFWKPGPVQMLLSADLCMEITTGSPMKLEEGYPHLIETVFGYVMIGRVPTYQSDSAICCFSQNEESILAENIQRFWEYEEVPQQQDATDDICEEHFQKHYYRTQAGRFGVAIPFKTESPELGPSKDRAIARFLNLEKKLAKDAELKTAYDNYMTDFINTGHLTQTSEPGKYYIPHLAVARRSRRELKVRTVFDCSMKTSKGSLNDHVFTGPKLQQNLMIILMNFRKHNFVFTTDIIKMFRQIEVREEDRPYLHILWRKDRSQPLDEYRINVLPFGLATSPYLALRVLKEVALQYGHQYPHGASAINECTYVDDIVTGADTINQACVLKSEIIDLLGKGQMKLSKWISNTPELMENSSDNVDNKKEEVDLIPADVTVKILGMTWDPHQDTFTYRVQLPQASTTKRAILSIIARLYDPMGLVSPAVFKAKVIMQKTWALKSGWDGKLPDDLTTEWQEFLHQLPNLEKIEIPRFLNTYQNCKCSVAGFCDASILGLAAAIYLIVGEDENYSSTLICSKTKLAPLKKMTVPRLELSAAVLLVELYKSIQPVLNPFNIGSVTCFTDSSIVLGWIRMDPYRLNLFVANRVKKIKERPDIIWRHITTDQNPADLGSRGVQAGQLIHCELWWNGPHWLGCSEGKWPISHIDISYEKLPEVKLSKKLHTVGIVNKEEEYVETFVRRFSSYSRCRRVLAWIKRFSYNAKANSRGKNQNKLSGALTVEEILEAEITLVKLHQSLYYPAVDTMGGTKQIEHLAPFIDGRGVIRVGGRLLHSSLSFSNKHPMLLPRRSPLTSLVVDYYHKLALHGGNAVVQHLIQLQFWIPSLKQLIKMRKLKCLVCIRANKRKTIPFMGNLPESRFSEVRPFYYTGVDFGGPFLCKESSRKNAPSRKAYLALFVCFSTKAIHLEVVENISTEAFLDALERFVSRRGLPYQITSDNGTNFVGANNFLREIAEWIQNDEVKHKISNFATSKAIRWSFIPPKAPHMGGLWESGIKVTKHLIRKYFGHHPFTFQELCTVASRIEAILNSRPLYPISSDPNDLTPLTPGHFLTGGAVTTIPEISLVTTADSRLSRWQFLKKCVQLYWRRWRREYLHTLQGRGKWYKHTPNLEVGDLVLIDSDDSDGFTWPLGRVTQTFAGKDGVVRVVMMRTAKGMYKRPVHKVVSLNALKPESDLVKLEEL